MSPLVESTAYIFGLVALGYLVSLAGWLRQGTGEALTEFATSIALPVLLFRTMASADFSAGIPWKLWGIYFAAAGACWAIGQASAALLFKRDERAAIIAGVASGFSNLVLLGLPFILAVYGHDGVAVLSLVVAIHMPTILGAATVLFAIADRRSGTGSVGRALAAFARNLATNPMIIGIAAGLAWRMTGLALPAIASRYVDTFALVAGPLALFAMGMGLRNFPLRGNVLPAMFFATIKLGLMPALVLAMAYGFGLPPMVAKVAVVSAALPTGVNPYLFAVRFGTGQALASNSLTIGTMVAALSASIWVAVVEMVFG